MICATYGREKALLIFKERLLVTVSILVIGSPIVAILRRLTRIISMIPSTLVSKSFKLND